jgi:hypothetical protein
MKKFTLPLALLVATALSAHAQVLINVQFGGSDYGSVATPQTGVGLIGSAGDKWNDFTSDANLLAGVSLNDSTGASTGATLTVTGTGGGANFTDPIYQYADGVGSSADTLSDGTNPDGSPNPSAVGNLASGELGAASSLTLNLTGLAADTTYQIYMLSAPDRWERSSKWSVNGGATQTVGPLNSYLGPDRPANPYGGSAPYDPILGINYLVLTGTTDGLGDLTLSGVSVSGDTNINGFQLEAVSSVPEPSVSALLIGGFLSLLIILRRRSRAAQG